VLEGFLESVPTSSADPLVVVVADNGAMTGGREADSRIIHCHLPLDRNLGCGGAMNEAIRSLPSGAVLNGQ
jgi:hypothetical protein